MTILIRWTFAIATLMQLMACGISALPQTKSHLNGTIGRDGGDQVTCSRSQSNPFFGDLVLDYILSHDGTRHPSFGSADEYLQNIVNHLDSKFPSLASSFKDYLKYLLVNDERNPRVWKPSQGLELNDISDEEIAERQYRFPENCLNGDGSLRLRQLVRREVYLGEGVDRSKIYYVYDSKALLDLKEKNPLQFSYIVVHEWLWDFVNSAWVNRTINHVFQSEFLATMTSTELKEHLKNLGVDNIAHSYPDIQTDFEKTISELVSEDYRCDFENRRTFDFLPLVQKVKLEAGKSMAIEMTVKDDSFSQPVCLAALQFGHGTTSIGSGSLKFRITKGVHEYPADNSFQTVASQMKVDFAGVLGQCNDYVCANQTGPLGHFITKRSMAGSRWKLEFKSDTDIEIYSPILLFIPKSPGM